ncbi:MAG: DNA topoisomerase III [Burkholderiales bacterium]|nr:DNA topoisomerase III [Burkholderiales bacterium]
MSKTLIIAEKPSVALDISKALGGFTKAGEYYESDRYVLSSAVGHLLEIACPEEYEVKRGKWSFAHLPVLPPSFDLKPIAKSEERLRVLMKLLRRKDVTELVNACDAGREGELIFRLIVQHAKAKQPIRRLWLQSMTPAAIRDGFASLRPDGELLPLADAARSRSEADWLIGINGTRAMTAFNSKEGGFYLTTVGRVQTPTLAILVEREQKIRAFKPRDYWEVHASFGAAAGEYAGRWFDAQWKKVEDDEHARAERLWSRDRAESIVAACTGARGEVSEETKPTTQSSPLLFDLTSLQREVNGRFGLSARNTLAVAQALYERHKVLTYPRTDSRALPEDYVGTVKKTVEMLKDSDAYVVAAGRVLKNQWIRPNKRVFDNAKVSDHFAIIPTLQPPKSLSEIEHKVYDLVVKRFLAVFHPPAEFLQTIRITTVGEHAFRTEGKVMVSPGWLAVYGRENAGEDQSLPAVAPGETVPVISVEARENQTRPPARYSEATLLSAMEGAGKLVEDEELREAMQQKGLGTPATRAATIEGLIHEEYVHRNGRELVPTSKAFSLMFALHHFGVTELASPELTGEWEYKLKEMEKGVLSRAAFMQHINEATRDLVDRIRDGEIPDTAFATVEAPCPKCGGLVQENYRKFQCLSCDFNLWKVISGREWSPEEIATLIRERNIGPLTGFRSKMGRPFAASLKLNADFRAEFDFGQDALEEGEAPDFSDKESLGACPKCGAAVFEHGSGYICEKAAGAARTCDFRSGRVILQQEVTPEQMRKLLAEGRTDLLAGFISNRTRRAFKAFLVKQPDGKIGFEFMQRAAKAPAKKGVRGKASTEAAEAAPVTPVSGQATAVAANDPRPPVRRVAKASKAVKKAAVPAGGAPGKAVKKTARRAAGAKSTARGARKAA